MGYWSISENMLDASVPVESGQVAHATRHQHARTMLRFGGLAMDSLTGTTYWRSQPITLSVEDRRLLLALLRRAGQIISRDRIAAMAGATVDQVDASIYRLRTRLKEAGATSLPCSVNGLGYILWRY